MHLKPAITAACTEHVTAVVSTPLSNSLFIKVLALAGVFSVISCPEARTFFEVRTSFVLWLLHGGSHGLRCPWITSLTTRVAVAAIAVISTGDSLIGAGAAEKPIEPWLVGSLRLFSHFVLLPGIATLYACGTLLSSCLRRGHAYRLRRLLVLLFLLLWRWCTFPMRNTHRLDYTIFLLSWTWCAHRWTCLGFPWGKLCWEEAYLAGVYRPVAPWVLDYGVRCRQPGREASGLWLWHMRRSCFMLLSMGIECSRGWLWRRATSCQVDVWDFEGRLFGLSLVEQWVWCAAWLACSNLAIRPTLSSYFLGVMHSCRGTCTIAWSFHLYFNRKLFVKRRF